MHWTEKAERVYDTRDRLVAECSRGDLWVPDRFSLRWRYRPNWWSHRLSLWRPLHWWPYLVSRVTRQIGWVDDL